MLHYYGKPLVCSTLSGNEEIFLVNIRNQSRILTWKSVKVCCFSDEISELASAILDWFFQVMT